MFGRHCEVSDWETRYFSKVKKIMVLRGGVLLYVAQAGPLIDAEIGENSRFRTETSLIDQGVSVSIERHLFLFGLCFWAGGFSARKLTATKKPVRSVKAFGLLIQDPNLCYSQGKSTKGTNPGSTLFGFDGNFKRDICCREVIKRWQRVMKTSSLDWRSRPLV